MPTYTRLVIIALLCILDHHESGVCWHGKFEAYHFVVRNNRLEFFIDLEDVDDLTQEGGIADLLKNCEIIFPLFEGEDAKHSLYFDEFQTDCMKMPDPEKEPVRWKMFLKLMRSPFALKAPSARSTLICNIYTLASERTMASRSFPPLNNRKCLVRWNRGLRLVEPFKGVYEHNNGNGLYMVDRWGSTYWYFLKFSRHFIQHVLDHLKVIPLFLSAIVLAIC
jgi:hypothetical protein